MTPIIKYFEGEKAESYVFIIMGILAFVMALYFIFVLKTPFWKGVATPFITVAILEFMVGYAIVVRSPKDIKRVEQYVQQNHRQIENEEIPRMKKVMRNFIIYRYVEMGLIVVGIVMMYSSLYDTFTRGLGLGLFIQASIVLCLDFFAERRGHVYLDYLKQFMSQL